MKPIYVTRSTLPPLDEHVDLLRDIWDRQWLTNGGRFHEELELALARYLGVPYVSLFCNGTTALWVGLELLRITGEVITTSYSFPATTRALHWNRCTQVFCDVDPATGNLDPAKVEALITPRTTAILPVHVYGTPCDVTGLQAVETKHGLKLPYDAAYAFDATAGGASILNACDLSMESFHATKVLNPAEGGTLVTADPKLKESIDLLKSHWIVDAVTIHQSLRDEGYLVRRYFNPLTSEFEMCRHLPSAANLPAATKLSRQVICLPIYPGLEQEEVDGICDLIREPLARVGSERSEEEPLRRPAEVQVLSITLDPIFLK